MELVKRTIRVGKHHDIIVKRLMKKTKLSQDEIYRRRIKPFAEMLKELEEDQKHSAFISLKNVK